MLHKDDILQKLALIVSHLDETSLQDLADVLDKLDFSGSEKVSLNVGWASEEDDSQRLGFINIQVDTKLSNVETVANDCW